MYRLSGLIAAVLTVGLFSVMLAAAPAVAAGCDVMRPCYSDGTPLFASKVHRRMSAGLAKVMAEGAGRVVAHPAGCPYRAFCGCGASVERFGRSIRALWLAANWLKFPRAGPAPGRAAVRPDGHHVVILRRHVRGHVWIVYDANSGRHLTRVHARSIAGYVIVDPSDRRARAPSSWASL